MYFTYCIEETTNRKIYIGHTDDLQKRIDRHNNLLNNKTTAFTSRQGASWKYIHVEGFSTRKEAKRREKELKSYQGRVFLNQFRLGP